MAAYKGSFIMIAGDNMDELWWYALTQYKYFLFLLEQFHISRRYNYEDDTWTKKEGTLPEKWNGHGIVALGSC